MRLLSAPVFCLAIAAFVASPHGESVAQSTEGGTDQSCRFERVIDLRTGTPSTIQRLLGEARQTQLVFVGERHGTAEHVELARCILEQKGQGRPPVLAMEHVPANFQSNLDEWRRTSLSDPDSFAERVGWGDLGWADFAVYRPLIETAGAVRAHIVGTDRPAFGAIGSLSADALLEVAPTYGLQTEDIIPLLVPDIINARCETVDEQMARRIALDQMERERIMAGRLIAGRGRGSSTLYIGARAHVRADAAIPYLLERTDRPPTMLRIAAYTADEWSTLTGGQGLTGLGLEGRFDVVVIAGQSDVSEADRCDQMREAMGLN